MNLINHAIKQALRSDCRHKLGAVVASGGRVLSSAPNRRRNSPSIDFRNATFHAEEAALRRLRDAANATVYVARVDNRGVTRLARPCLRCQVMLLQAGVRRAYFTVSPTEIDLLDFR
ncbi:hypothetical protein [Streptomyces sp. NBC_00289]|uniref:hypothetical protein n=1 Tax=Streptomyces sp. NBC_00289 TaxID=2975703 RepID=UPI00352D6BBB